MTELAAAIADAGGTAAPGAATARLRALLLAALRHGRAELGRKRSGYDKPVEVAVGHHDGWLLAATPAAAALRADPEQAAEREWLLVAAAVGALVAFGTGVGGFPVDEAARIEVEEVQGHLAGGSQLERIVFAVHGERARAAFQAAIDAAAG